MEVKNIDDALIELIEKKIQLSKLDYNDDTYDKVEDDLHEKEDNFYEQYGAFLEEALQDVHDEICPDNDVLLPTAYIAPTYVRMPEDRHGRPVYDIPYGNGVLVEADDYPNKEVRIALLPNPLRIIMMVRDRKERSKEVVWRATQV